ncbi:phage tail protein [Variovorax sp. PMC12]|uniref:phage tail protein n=1 Tax=Variovorax sp. PMC12 TaxID=2126319 RepID=UPI000D13BF8B|nr:phage tail protein [Variovorax sp. PMC12]AVQ80755.1 phage tail protein [Variovorax sp. PMC12]
MASTLTPTTELDAVNQMLGTIGEAPVNTLIGVTSLDTAIAINTLAEISRDIQSKGHHFNTDKGLKLQPGAFTGEIEVPINCVDIDTVDPDGSVDVVLRGRRLYDRVNHTYKFTAPLTVDMVVLLPFGDLPESARRYIAVRACRVFQKRQVGSTTLATFTAEDEREALMSFRRSLGRNADHNIFNSPDMRRMLRRSK